MKRLPFHSHCCHVETGNKCEVSSVNSKQRIDYIDLLKGFAILWIIWVHTDHPEFGGYRNPIFFFASGIFFKLMDFKFFFKKRIRNILVPFLFFYIASVPFRIVVHLWDNRTFSGFNWNVIFDVFKILPNSDYLSVNVPLWFLLTLFVIHAVSFFVFRLPDILILILALMSFFFRQELLAWPTIFMFNNALFWFGFFAIGFLTGKPLIKFMDSTKHIAIVFFSSLALTIACIAVDNYVIDFDYAYMIEQAKYIVVIFLMISFFACFNGMKQLEFLRFFGANSLIVLGAHMWILIPIVRIMFRLTRMHDPAIGFLMACVTALILIPIIRFFNRKLPFFVGK